MPLPNEDTTPPVMNTNFVMNELTASKERELASQPRLLAVVGSVLSWFFLPVSMFATV